VIILPPASANSEPAWQNPRIMRDLDVLVKRNNKDVPMMTDVEADPIVKASKAFERARTCPMVSYCG
jgi:hypothetical protein